MTKYLLFIFSLFSIPIFSQQPEFVPNGGQWHENVLFKADVGSGAVFIEKKQISFLFYDPTFFHNIHEGKGDSVLHCHLYQMKFMGANSDCQVVTKELVPGVINYFLGKDQSKWASGLRAGREVIYKNLYEGIDLRIVGGKNGLKYEFIVYPGADPSKIKYEIIGADSLFISRNELHIETSVNQVIDQVPVSFQKGQSKPIKTEYVLENNMVSFSLLDPYRRQDTLVIDPFLDFSTFSGSLANNFGYTATYDRFGFLYAGGSVFGVGYVTTPGAFDITFNSLPPTGNWGVSDLGITKYDTTGTFRIYSTYIGGQASELPHSLIVNSRDELYIFGTTGSADFPTTPGAYDNSFAGGTLADYRNGVFVRYDLGTDIFVTKLNDKGTALLGSTFVGGSGNDGLNHNLAVNYADQMRGEVILDENELPIIATSTHSTDLPVSSGALQTTLGGKQDGVIFKMNSDLTSLTWLTYFGGTNDDGIYSVIRSNDGNLLVSGGTRSSDIPIDTSQAYQPINKSTWTLDFRNSIDGFFSKISGNGQQVLGGSYLGSQSYDQCYFIRQDRDSMIYLMTQSFAPTNEFIVNAAFNNPGSETVITKFSARMDSIIWSTRIGNGVVFNNQHYRFSPTAFMVDLCNKVYFSGYGPVGGLGFGPPYPITLDAFQSTSVNNDFYVAAIEDDASALYYGSYFGGALSDEHVDGGTSRFDPKGVIYQSVCAGCQNNSDFPIKPNPGAVSATNNSGGCNNGVFKFNFEIPSIIADFEIPVVGCYDTTYQFVNTSRTMDSTTYFWDFGDGGSSTDKNPTHQFNSVGPHTVKLIIRDPTSCNLIDSIAKVFTFRNDSVFVFGGDTVCKGDSLQIALSRVFPDSSTYNWNPGIYFSDSTRYLPKVRVNQTDTFLLSIHSNYGCMDTVIYPVFVPQYQLILSDTLACLGDTIFNFVRSNPQFKSYLWSSKSDFSDQLNPLTNDSSFQYIVGANDSTFYILVTDKNNCEFTDSLRVQSRSLSIQLSSDTIVCDQLDIERAIIFPSYSALDSISWEPFSKVVANADSTVATLSIYSYFSDYFVFARDTFGCTDRDTLRIVDNSLDLDLPDTTICFGDTINIGYQLSYNPLYTYEWTPAGQVFEKDSLATQASPSDSVQLYLLVNNSFCVDSVGLFISVNKINISGQQDTVICNSVNTYKLMITGEDTLNYLWSTNNLFTDTVQNGLGLKDYMVSNVDGEYNYFVQAKDDWGCFDTVSVSLIRSTYDLSYKGDTVLCLNDTVQLQPLNPPADYQQSVFSWSPSPVVFTDTTLSAVKAYASPGSYMVYVRSVNQYQCIDTDSIVVNFSKLDTTLISAVVDQDQILRGEEAVITVEPSGYAYILDPNDYKSLVENKFTVEPQVSTTYSIWVNDPAYVNCSSSKRVAIEVLDFICEDPYIYLPNAFSPNGDGENDVLYIRGKNLQKVYLAIYNRWGQLVFETENQHNGWDGTYQGMPIDPAVYDYYMRWECNPGEEHFKKGNITLIR